MLEVSHPDRPVVDALLRGDEQAFRALVARHYAAMVRVAQRYVSAPDIAEDVVQDTWLAVLAGLARFEGRDGASLKTWIFAILVNNACTRGARDRRVVPFSSIVAAAAAAHVAVDVDTTVDAGRFRPNDHRWGGHWSDPPQSIDPTGGVVEDVELRRTLEAAIASLPPAQQQVVWLRDVEGWTAAEVCEALDLSEANQRVVLHRGRMRLRDRLERSLRASVTA